MRGIFIFCAVSALHAAPVTAAPKIGKAERAAIAASPQDVANVVEIKNDDFDTHIRLSTEPFYTERQGLLKVVNSDKFLRAIIDKKTGEAVFQLYMWTIYTGEWSKVTHLTYRADENLESVDAVELSNTLLGCDEIRGCRKRLDIVFTLNESTLRQAGANAQAGTDRMWPFKIFTQGLGDGMSGIMETEIAGLLLAVDAERAKLPK